MKSANLGISMRLGTAIAVGALLMGSAAAQKNDFLIVPGQRVGPITAATTRADLDTLFGKENVQDGNFDSSDVPEAATVVFGNDASAGVGGYLGQGTSLEHPGLLCHQDRPVQMADGKWNQDWPAAHGTAEA